MSLFVCPKHGLHHGPVCCNEPQEWWDGTFADEASGTSGSAQDAQRLDPKGAGPTAEGGDAQTPQEPGND